MNTATLDFKGLTDDLSFKYFFANKKTLEDFINSFFQFIGLNKKFKTTNVSPQSYIIPKKKICRGYLGDIIAILDNGETISLEMYKDTFSKEEYNKSFCYAIRLFDNQITNQKYSEAKKVYSLNLIKGNFRRLNNELVNTYEFQNNKTYQKIDNGNIEMSLIRFDLLHKTPYNENEQRFIRWLRIINATTLEEAKKIGKDDEIMENSIKSMERWLETHSGQQAFEDWTEAQVEKQIKKRTAIAEKQGRKEGIKQGIEKGIEKGIEQGIEKGIEQGIEQGIKETVKNFLTIGISIDDIMKATGLAQKEIEALK